MDPPKGTIVFFSMDALGHIHPSLSIVQELRARGYRAIIVTPRPLSMAARLESQGFELDYCDEVVPSPDKENSQGLMESFAEKFRAGPVAAFKNTYATNGPLAMHLADLRHMHKKIEAKLRSLKPDLILVDHIVGIPCTTTVAPKWIRTFSAFPAILYSCLNDNYVSGLGLKADEVTPEQKKFESDAKRGLREKVRQFWAEQGQADWPHEIDMVKSSPYMNFYFGPDELSLDRIKTMKPIPDTWVRLEHTIMDNPNKPSFQIPDCLVNKPGKLIYFSLGTLVTSDYKLINRLLEILSKSPNRFIISMGVMYKNIKLYPNMWGEKFLDQKGILPKSDLFITHGGHNSIIEAFYYGVPGLVVLPVFADQFDGAQRVEDCGFGVRLNPFDCSEQDLLGAVDKLLANDDIKARMQRVAKRLQSIKYHEVAADKIEMLLKA